MFLACFNVRVHVVQPDVDVVRIEEGMYNEFLGAAPRAAVATTGLRRRTTFKVRKRLPASSGFWQM